MSFIITFGNEHLCPASFQYNANIPYIKCPFIVLKIPKIEMNKIQVVLHNYTWYCRRERRTKTMPPLGGGGYKKPKYINTYMYVHVYKTS